MDLIKNQEELHKEAEKVIEELDLINFLSPYGPVDIGGSYKTGLMVWRDIDMGVMFLPSEDELWKIARKIYDKPHINSLTIMNNLKRQNPHYPKGWYFGIKWGYGGVVWKIDLWFANEKADIEMENWIIANLNDEFKKTILEIKSQVWEDPKYAKKIL